MQIFLFTFSSLAGFSNVTNHSFNFVCVQQQNSYLIKRIKKYDQITGDTLILNGVIEILDFIVFH